MVLENLCIDFHSNTAGGAAQDSRVVSQNGTTSAYGATFNIFTPPINNSGSTGDMAISTLGKIKMTSNVGVHIKTSSV